MDAAMATFSKDTAVWCWDYISALQCVTVHISWCQLSQGGQTLQFSIKELQAASKGVFSRKGEATKCFPLVCGSFDTLSI